MKVTDAVVILTLVGAGLLGAVIHRNRELKAPLPIVTFALVLALGFGVVRHDQEQAQQQLHEDCIQRVERAVGNRAMWTDLGSYLAQHGLIDASIFVQQRRDINIPSLDITQC